MAKGDFIHADPNPTSYASADFQVGRNELGTLVAGVTLLFLFVTVKLQKRMLPPPEPGPGEEVDAEAKPVCLCVASITDYSLQANIYIDKNVPAGIRQTGVLLHELYHLLHKKREWTDHKAELDTLLGNKDYPCSDDSRTQIVQDLMSWMIGTFFADPRDEERDTQRSSKMLQGLIDGGVAPDKALDSVFGKERLKENSADAKPDGDLPLKGRFESRVIMTWEGSCA